MPAEVVGTGAPRLAAPRDAISRGYDQSIVSRRRMLRLAAIGAAMLVALAGTTLVALPGVVRWLVVSQLSRTTGHPVTLDALEAEVFRGRIGLRGLRVIDRDGDPLLTVGRADVRFSPRDLIGGHLRVFEATVQSVALRIVRTGPETFNVSELLARLGEGPGSASALTIARFALVGGVVTLEDRTLTPPRSWRIEALALHATEASTQPGARPGAATLHAVMAGAPISVSVTDLRLSPLHLRATLNARDLDATLAALALPSRSPLSPTQGTVTVSATIDHDGATGSLIALDAGFAGVTLHRPGQASAYLSAPAVRLTVDGLRVRPAHVALERLAVNAGVIRLEDTRLAPVRRWQVDGVVFEARNLSSAREGPPGIATGRAGTAGARLEVWVTNLRLAPLELHATTIVRNVDLALFQLYVPPNLPVRAERGVVNATVQVEHGGAGTRLALDASLGAIALQRPGHWVASPAVRIIASDIALGGGAVTAGRVAVVSDRLTLEERTARPVRTWPVENLSVEAKDLSSRREAVQGVARLNAVVAGATVSVFVTGARLAPLELRATAVLRDVDAALLRLYVPAGVPIQLSRGRVNATFQVDHSTEATTLTGEAILTALEAQGRDAFATLAVTAPALRVTIADGRRRGGDLSVGRVELSGAGVFTDSRGASARFDLTQLRIATEGLTWPASAPARVEASLRLRDRGEIDGSGTARLTAPLPTIAWAAELALQLRAVDLSPLASYIPGADGLGGRVRATLTVDLAYATALTVRVRGDVGGARFALTDGTRTLLALRSINATGLDLQWPDRMTIARLRLRQPYALIERDRQVRFPLLARFAASVPPPEAAGTPSSATPGTARPRMAMTFEEIVVENGRAAVVDDGGASPVRFEIPRVDLTARRVTWPASGPAQLRLEAGLPAGGMMAIEGSVNAEPLSADVTVAVTDADVAWLQPYLGFRARVGGRLSANLTVSGPLVPAPRLRIGGDVSLRALDIADGQRSVLTTDQLRITGIDAAWPERISLGRVHARRSWARIERDRQGRFLLHTLLERPGVGALRPAPSTPTAPAAPPAQPPPSAPVLLPGSTPALTVQEAVLEEQAATIVDDTTTPPLRMDVAGARLTVRDLAWPSGMPATLELTSPMPAGGRLDLSGTVQLEPFRLAGRAVLDGVALEPAQPYLPIDGRVAGKVTGDVSLNVALEPVAIQIAGQARLQGFRLSDGDRAVVTVGRVDTTEIDIDWPTRIAVGRVQFRRPRLLVERDAHGQFLLSRLVTPHWGTEPAVAPPPAPPLATRSAPPSPPTPSTRPTIEIATFGLERASARFVDHTTTPVYAEELEDLNVTFTPLTTAPGRRTRVTATGVIGGGTLTLRGEGTEGDRRRLDLRVDVQRYILPRANPYLEKYTGWTATTGSLNVSGSYKLEGAQLETQHDLVVRGLEVTPIAARDEVEQRIGLPLGMLVSLLKDSRGEIRLSVPVAGDVGTLAFDYDEAVWGTVRNLAIRLLALPFSKVGSLFFSDDSKVTAVAIGPALFEAGTDHLRPEMGPHLDRVAAFLREAPAAKVVLDSIAVESDRQALRHEQVRARLAGPAIAPPTADLLEPARQEYSGRWPDKPMPATLDAIVAELAATEMLPAETLRTLAARRLDVVRQRLASGGVDVARVTGGVARRPFVEAAGAPRVEFDLRP
jgi:hypothetical protein